MRILKIKLLPKSQVKLIYENGKKEIRKVKGLLMKPWEIKASLEGKNFRLYGTK